MDRRRLARRPRTCATPSSTSCTSARSPPRARSTAAIEHLPGAGRARRHRHRADAGRRVPGPPQLGLRRRLPQRRAVQLRRPARASQRLVDAAHAAGLGVVLDVVYNHLGRRAIAARRPSAPTSPTSTRRPGARRSTSTAPTATRCASGSLQSAEGWVRDFHVDGLRLDAIHAIYDIGASHILRGAGRPRPRAATTDAVLIAESDLNDPKVIRPRGQGGWGCDAQWADDFHHALHALLTGERRRLLRRLRRASSSWPRRTAARSSTTATTRPSAAAASARPPDDRPGEQFVVFDQNHDQVGNRAFGDRLPAEVRPLAAFCTLLSPYVPMLFMGEEYGEDAPFQFFTDHIDEQIADATREGRRREFAAFAAFAAEDVPDPQDPETFAPLEAHPHGRPGAWPRSTGACSRCAATCRRAPTRTRWTATRPGRGCGCAAARSRSRPTSRRTRRRCPSARRSRSSSRPTTARACTTAGRPAGPRRSARPMSRPEDTAAREVWPGQPFPLGATWDGRGTNFSLFSENATRVTLCLFDADDVEEHPRDRRAHGPHLALLRAGRAPRPVLRLPRRRRLRPVGRAPLQPEQAADRPVRQGDRGPGPLGRGQRRCPTPPTARRTPTSSPTTRTTPRRSRSRSSSTRASTGKATRRRARRGTRR